MSGPYQHMESVRECWPGGRRLLITLHQGDHPNAMESPRRLRMTLFTESLSLGQKGSVGRERWKASREQLPRPSSRAPRNPNVLRPRFQEIGGLRRGEVE